MDLWLLMKLWVFGELAVCIGVILSGDLVVGGMILS